LATEQAVMQIPRTPMMQNLMFTKFIED
jgi:hypothetical protein